MSKPWEQVKTVSVAATTSFRIPLMDDDFAIFSVPGKRVVACVYLRSKSNATFDESERTTHDYEERDGTAKRASWLSSLSSQSAFK